MADIITGFGINIFDGTYTGGDPSKIASVTSGRLIVDGSEVTQPVSIVEPSSGNVVAYGTAASVAANTSTVVSYYQITGGTTFYLKGVVASASAGPVKVIIEYAATSGGASSGTYCVGFFSSADPTLNFNFTHPIVISGATYIRVSMRNGNTEAQDLYASIIGYSI
jgi:hypothetical protein